MVLWPIAMVAMSPVVTSTTHIIQQLLGVQDIRYGTLEDAGEMSVDQAL